MHAICSKYDPSQPIHHSNWCPTCWESSGGGSGKITGKLAVTSEAKVMDRMSTATGKAGILDMTSASTGQVVISDGMSPSTSQGGISDRTLAATSQEGISDGMFFVESEAAMGGDCSLAMALSLEGGIKSNEPGMRGTRKEKGRKGKISSEKALRRKGTRQSPRLLSSQKAAVKEGGGKTQHRRLASSKKSALKEASQRKNVRRTASSKKGASTEASGKKNNQCRASEIIGVKEVAKKKDSPHHASSKKTAPRTASEEKNSPRVSCVRRGWKEGAKKNDFTGMKESSHPSSPEKTSPEGGVKKKSMGKTKPAAKPASKRTAKKRVKKVNIKGPKASETEDRFIKKDVAFHLSGPSRPDWLTTRCDQYATTVGSKQYLCGHVVRRDKSKKGGSYIVEWNNTMLGSTKLDASVIFDALKLAEVLKKGRKVSSSTLTLDPNLITAMTEYSDNDERRDPLDSDTDEEVDDDNIGVVGVPPITASCTSHTTLEELLGLPSEEDDVVEEKQAGLKWIVNGCIDKPINVASNQQSYVKIDSRSRFINPMSSFLAFVPVEFWKMYVFHTNLYARRRFEQERQEGKGRYHNRIWVDVTLDEFMTFFGILIKMTLRPTPGQRYTVAWNDQGWHPYCSQMERARFVEIRSMLHMADSGIAESRSNDELYKIHPLVNVLKKTLPAYMEVGAEVALDESSIACHSAYGRSLIFYNKTKPTGKYHFRIYLVCESDSYACMRFRIHTRMGSDTGDGVPDVEESTDQDEILVSLVKDMMKPFYHTGWVMNCDNYYTSPRAFIELKKAGVFARGTCCGWTDMFS